MGTVRVKRRNRSRGTAVVEMAFVLPLLLLLALGAIHYGWLFYHLQKVTNAARHSARIGTLPGRTDVDVKQSVASLLNNYTINVDDTQEVEITYPDITVDGETVSGISVVIRLRIADNPQVRLIDVLPFGPDNQAEYLGARVTMALEGG